MGTPPPDSGEAWIVRQARECPQTEREAFLEGACGGDPALRERVEELLKAEEAAASGAQKMGHTCRRCGAELQGQGPEELCHKCSFLEAVFPAREEGSTEAEEKRPGFYDELPGTVIGHYRLLEKIGEGGFGSVYVAEQIEPVRRKVALKIIKPGMDTRQVVARFEVERQALAMIDHPNIAKVLDGGATANGRPYFVMELIHGIPITRYCDENNLSTEKRLELFSQTCEAIHHAHQRGIIHRDIKPSNILVSLQDGIPVPKVIDFGIAKATTGQQLTDKTVFTLFEQFLGTPAYVSPEQADMSALGVDTRTDIYSLGVLLYELLVGTTPLDTRELIEAGLEAMRRQIREREPLRPSRRISSLPAAQQTTVARRRGAELPSLMSSLKGDLDCLVMKALEKDRTLRYDSAKDFAQDVRRYLNHDPVSAAGPSLRYRLRRFARRKRAVLGVVATMAFVIVSLATSLYVVWREPRGGGEAGVAPEDQAALFPNAVAEAAFDAEVAIREATRITSQTNAFICERRQSLSLGATRPQLLNFLRNLAESNSVLRVRDLSLRPDPDRTRLTANVVVVGHYRSQHRGGPRTPELPETDYLVLNGRRHLRYTGLDCYTLATEDLPVSWTLDELNFEAGKRLSLKGQAPADQVHSVKDVQSKLQAAKDRGGEDLFRPSASKPEWRMHETNLFWSIQLELWPGTSR
jgi:serine/threonine protein kinase